MMRKAFAIGVVAVLMLCVLPAVAEESDASVTERSNEALYHAELTIPSTMSWYSNAMIFLEGSENHQVMLDYIADPKHAEIPTEDDSEEMTSGDKVHLYGPSPSIYYQYREFPEPGATVIYYPSISLSGTLVVPASYISFFVMEGEPFHLDITSLSDSDPYSSPRVQVMAGANVQMMGEGDDMDETFGTNTVISIIPTYGDVAVDVTYVATGYSLPNGSATVFAVAAIVVAAAILAILILCGLKPKWGA